MNFLIEHFGLEFLRSGNGILDVAGGTGGLAFELAFRAKIKCTVVDPRPMRLNNRQRRAIAYHFPAATDVTINDQAQDGVAIDSNNNGIHVPVDYAAAWSAHGLHAESAPRQIQELFDENFANGPYSDIWNSTSIVVGMHPDGATEAIVRLALSHDKPFAVVPCCVFPNTNTHRMLTDGTRVRSHPEFCTFLQEMDQNRVETTQLLFPARNIVVHTSTFKS